MKNGKNGILITLALGAMLIGAAIVLSAFGSSEVAAQSDVQDTVRQIGETLKEINRSLVEISRTLGRESDDTQRSINGIKDTLRNNLGGIERSLDQIARK